MTNARIVLSVATGVVLGGLCLCGLGALLLAHPGSESPAQAYSRHEFRLYEIRQIGLAVLQYTGDHDDAFPPPTEAISAISPYVVKLDLGDDEKRVLADLKRLDWKIPAPYTMTSFERPELVEMASLDDRDGRAVVYIDGHARWKHDRGTARESITHQAVSGDDERALDSIESTAVKHGDGVTDVSMVNNGVTMVTLPPNASEVYAAVEDPDTSGVTIEMDGSNNKLILTRHEGLYSGELPNGWIGTFPVKLTGARTAHFVFLAYRD